MRKVVPAAAHAWILEHRKLLGIASMLLLVGIAVGFLASRTPSTNKVTIATGTDGGTYSVVGKQLAGILDHSQRRSTRFTAVSSQGDVENLDLLKEGKADIAFVGEPVLAAEA